jgi:hypothetical protein
MKYITHNTLRRSPEANSFLGDRRVIQGWFFADHLS